MNDYEVIIIGAGVVGLACTEKISKRFNSALVIERHPGFGWETSSRNSEVIHAGIYYPKNSLKAELCVAGNISLYNYCQQNNIPHRKIGKYIIARTNDELGKLDDVYQKAISNGVEGIRYASKHELLREEPNVKAVSALFSSETGIIDTHSLMSSLETKAQEHGVDFAYNHSLISIEKDNIGYRLGISSNDADIFFVTCKYLINSAGLDSDLIAEMAGVDTHKEKYKLDYCRGHYFRITSNKKHLVKHLIYPVPNDNLSGLGIHVTIDLKGELKLGPDTQYLKTRIQDYTIPEELNNKFYTIASSYLPDLKQGDIYPDQSGIRPKLQAEDEKFRDFIIIEESDKNLPGLINLIGIESPGLTCCLEIAKRVDELLAQ